jgi:hypothetical protein
MKASKEALEAFKEALESEGELELHMEEYDGLCLACGEWSGGGCEPDARNYECEACGARAVYGTEECLMMLGG